MKVRGSYPYKVTTKSDGEKEISFPQFPGMSTTVDGNADKRTVYKAAHQCLLIIFTTWMHEKLPIPGGEELDSGTGDAYVFVSWLTLAKLILYKQFCAADVTPSAFAKQIGISATSFKRLLDPRHESKEKVIFSALETLGIKTDWDINARPIKHSYPT